MKKVLFLIHDLGQGGAEKVLVNLVNNMDHNKFDITVMALFGGGVNERFLKPHVKYKTIFRKSFPGNSRIMKLISPRLLHKLFVKEHFDIEVSYLEGTSARIISGCTNKNKKLVSWIHCTMKSTNDLKIAFRSESEATKCYNKFDCMAFVSKGVMNAFLEVCEVKGKCEVLYNTIESEYIKEKSREETVELDNKRIKLISVGTLKTVKGYDRLLRIVKRLKDEKYNVHLYLLGIGPDKTNIENYINSNFLADTVTLLGYHTNPYKYMGACDVYVCSSYSEGFSTAVTEALILGTSVVTTDVSGMKEMLGEGNEYGIVTENTEEALYCGIRMMLSTPKMIEFYSEQAKERGKYFSTENTTKAVESMLADL